MFFKTFEPWFMALKKQKTAKKLGSPTSSLINPAFEHLTGYRAFPIQIQS